ncbi:TRAP transporter small permease [Ramlibacter pallidus]|uniref:TRAP transporter small permease protein n=1 Tax=Ramlibacter pallidus TaxID=2780087 RepID=A0ABR9S986_9BURK|nr:TRAP transporter small permease [Ramlibacter pallidus]MBE7370120.1 TRAP transporter small permease [Ramlibacter pallidus]
MQKASDLFFKLLELLVVVALVAMVIMVFGNVVLRYAFNSGILVSEELSRYCFIWLTYIGAMIAMRDREHLGVDTLVRRLPRAGKMACLFLSEAMMLGVNVLFFVGTWKMHELQVTNVSPVVGISMIWVYGVGYVVAVVMALFNLAVLYRLLAGKLSDDELVQVVESEDMPHIVVPEPQPQGAPR